jgi:hypothetical protein
VLRGPKIGYRNPILALVAFRKARCWVSFGNPKAGSPAGRVLISQFRGDRCLIEPFPQSPFLDREIIICGI